MKNLPFSDWPIPQTKYETLYLSGDGQLLQGPSSITAGTISYQGDAPTFQVDDDPEEVHFSWTFKEKTALIGASKAVLYMSCPDHDDFDVFVQLRKADKNGRILRHVNVPLDDLRLSSEDQVIPTNVLVYLGPTGILRASHRELDPVLSKPHWPAHDHTRENRIPPGTVARLEIGIWPAAIEFEAGEKLVLKVSGHHMTLAEFEPLRGESTTGNKGKQFLHVGGKYGSHIQIPTIPLYHRDLEL